MGGKTLTTNMDPATDGAGSDSQTFTDLRDNYNKLEKALKTATTRADNAEAEAHAKVKREQEAATLLSMSGLQGLADVVAGEVDGDINEDSVARWVNERNLKPAPATDDNAASDDTKEDDVSDQTPDTPASDVAGVSDLASQVAAANEDSDMQNLSKRIDAIEEDANSLDGFADSIAEIVNQ